MIGFVAGAAAGYVLGTRAGRQRYEQIKRVSAKAWHSDLVQQRIEAAGVAVKTQAVPYVADKVGDAVKAQRTAAKLLELGIYAVGFFYPVVPLGTARIRTQLSSAHTFAQLDRAIEAFALAARD